MELFDRSKIDFLLLFSLHLHQSEGVRDSGRQPANTVMLHLAFRAVDRHLDAL